MSCGFAVSSAQSSSVSAAGLLLGVNLARAPSHDVDRATVCEVRAVEDMLSGAK